MMLKSVKSLEIIILILLTMFLSCSKDKDNTVSPTPIVKFGSVVGKVNLINKYEGNNLDYTDAKIEIIDSLNNHRNINLDSLGIFRIDSIPYGLVLLVVNKPGYGVIDTLSFNLKKDIDTLSNINLSEELPFSYSSFSVNFSDGMLNYHRSTSYQTSDSYLVGQLFCFSKYSNVSLSNCEFFISAGGYSDVKYINSEISSSMTFSLDSFTKNGFQIGETVYAVCYPIIHGSFTLYNDKNQNFKILSYKTGRYSNVSSFILKDK